MPMMSLPKGGDVAVTSVVLILNAITLMGAAVERHLDLPTSLASRPAVGVADISATLDAAAKPLLPGVRQSLAVKPVPWLVKTHDVGSPTDFHKDIPWHLLDKDKDARFDLPHRGKLGVFNTNSDVHLLIGLGVDDKPVNFNPKRQYTDHLLNLASVKVDLDDILGQVLFLAAESDTLLSVVQVQNLGPHPHIVRVEAACTKPRAEKVPFDRFGYGVTATTGDLQWIGYNEPNGALVSSYDEWIPGPRRLGGTLLCVLAASEPPAGRRTALTDHATPSGIPRDAVLEHRVELPAGASRTLLLSLNLHRYGPQQYESPMEMILYPKQTPEEALQYSVFAAIRTLSVDWPRLVADSFKWYEHVPLLTVPPQSWAADFLCALELPRANTWSPQEQSSLPWYTLCRPHTNEPYGWWSYGMHGHEDLSTFVVNLTEPTLSQSFLRGHFRNQQPDGRFPYGVNHRGVSAHSGDLATAPFLAWESWTTYLWRDDRKFLQEAYDCCARSLRWWCSPARTRPGMRLQHWKDFLETVRDDGDLATWTATDKAENQEALDLNCYLLKEERTLAEMARELGRSGESSQWKADAEQRAAVMREHFWHAEDGVYYGRDIAGDRWARIMDISTFFPLWCGLATPQQVPAIVDLLRDPTAFGANYPVATLAVRHMPDRLKGQWHWRGANWVEMTWLVICGLKEVGRFDEAARLAEINCRMVFQSLEKDGHFREYYNSLTGEPADLTDYIWTSIPAIMIVDVILGIRPTAEGVEIMPALPESWPDAAIDSLRLRASRLSVSVRRDTAGQHTRAALNGRALPVREGRGILVQWSDLPADARIEITQPSRVAAVR
ncbi:MAG TPA: trehalase family glycosidase [Phycisphaerae bacterium]|nr:trehalase family glycosidase [Phycisphaerae bacterium]